MVAMGYERVYQVENAGQFAVRGGIIDIFSLTKDCPVRMELWDDEIDSIRTFDALSQRSIENLEVVTTALRIISAGNRDGIAVNFIINN